MQHEWYMWFGAAYEVFNFIERNRLNKATTKMWNRIKSQPNLFKKKQKNLSPKAKVDKEQLQTTHFVCMDLCACVCYRMCPLNKWIINNENCSFFVCPSFHFFFFVPLIKKFIDVYFILLFFFSVHNFTSLFLNKRKYIFCIWADAGHCYLVSIRWISFSTNSKAAEVSAFHFV